MAWLRIFNGKCSGILLILLLLAQAAQAGEWPMRGHDAAHTDVADEIVEPPLELSWEYTTVDWVNSSPAISNGRVYTASKDSSVNAFVSSNNSVHNINKGLNYTTIQAAVNDADPNDEIYVHGGTYFEIVNITKRLIMHGKNMPVIDAEARGNAVTLSADGIFFGGFYARGANESGIRVVSKNNTLLGNNASDNKYGILLWYSDDNLLILNNAFNNEYGLSLESSRNNTLSNNYASSNNMGFYVFDSNKTNLTGNQASNNEYAIFLHDSLDNIVKNNNISKNKLGVYLSGFSSSNRIYNNNLINNTNQSMDYDNTNFWNSGYQEGGNYWSDYIGIDNRSGPNQDKPGRDGIGDTPYVINGSVKDLYPFMKVNGWISDPDNNDDNKTITITGMLNKSIENCIILIDKGGDKYELLINGSVNIPPLGTMVQITGLLRTDISSFCMEGKVVEVYEILAFLPGITMPPGDPDRDGLYEDLNGNGRKDFKDVELLFEYLEWIAKYEPLQYFDFNGNGRIDYDDVIRLFDEL